MSRQKRGRPPQRRQETGSCRRCRECRTRAESSGRSDATSLGRLAVILKNLAQTRAELGMFEAQRDGGLEITELVSAIIAASGRTEAVKGLALGDQRGEPVGELDLVAG